MTRKRLRCWIGLHSWAKFVREGQSWMECRYCGKYVDQASLDFRVLRRRPLVGSPA